MKHFVDTRQATVDLVHFHSTWIPEHVAAAELLRVPYVISPQGGYSPGIVRGRHRWFKAAWMYLREAAYVRRAAFLHSVSAREADALRDMFPGAPIQLIAAAVDVPPFLETMQRAHHENGAHKDLVYLGRMVIAQKGLDVLVQGYADFLARTDDQTTRLVLIGPDHQGGRAQLASLSHTLHIADRVVFRDPLFGPDKWTSLHNAYAFVHPSRWEGLPNAVMEAMAASCPVLVTPGTNLADVVRSHDAGVSVECARDGLSRGLEVLVGLSPERHLEMGRRARQLVDEHFSWSVTAQRMAHAYFDVLAGRRHRPWTARPYASHEAVGAPFAPTRPESG